VIQNSKDDFGALYRSAFAERDPEKKQMLLSQVQRAISDSEEKQTVGLVKLGAQSSIHPESKIAVAA
jgi:hypothetical protein